MALDPQALLQFMADDLGLDTEDVKPDTPLFSSGLIDSAGMVNLILYVETESGVKFSPDDINLDNLDSIERIAAFLAAARES